MDARGPPAEDLASFLNGFEFGLAAIRGRVEEMGPDPNHAELLATLEEYRSLVDRIREGRGRRRETRRPMPRPRRR